MNEILEQLLEGIDFEELKGLKGFSRYLVDLSGKVYDTEKEVWKKNTVNAKGYVYLGLVNDEGKTEVMSLHQIVMAAALEVEVGWWHKFNLVIDHRNSTRNDNHFRNLALISQSENVKKRENIKPYKRFTKEELKELQADFEDLDKMVFGEYHSAYNHLAQKFSCAPITIQTRYLDYKKAQ